MHVVIFEGTHWNTFAPLSLSRPVFMLGTGTSTLLEKQIRHTNPTRLTLWVRPELVEFCRKRIVPRLQIPCQVNTPLDDELCMLVSGRTLHFRRYSQPEQEAAVIDPGDVVRAAFVRRPGLSPVDVMQRSERWMGLMDLPRMDPQTRMVERLWDLIKWNEESLIEDSAHLPAVSAHPAGPYHMIQPDSIHIGADVTINPGVVLDASKGPIMIDHDAIIGANAVLQGPCYIGAYVNVTALSLIRAGTSVGMMSKVGGEVSNSIIFGYTNKAHGGYLGDSYVGKWVNIGADTNTSNVKNTYGEITVLTPNGVERTGRRFLGALIGDHVKTAIGTRLMAGTYVGFASQLAGSTIAPKFIPSFTFWTDKGMEGYRVGKAVDVMKTVFGRRDRQWTDIDQTIVDYVAETAPGMEVGTK